MTGTSAVDTTIIRQAFITAFLQRALSDCLPPRTARQQRKWIITPRPRQTDSKLTLDIARVRKGNPELAVRDRDEEHTPQIAYARNEPAQLAITGGSE